MSKHADHPILEPPKGASLFTSGADHRVKGELLDHSEHGEGSDLRIVGEKVPKNHRDLLRRSQRVRVVAIWETELSEIYRFVMCHLTDIDENGVEVTRQSRWSNALIALRWISPLAGFVMFLSVPYDQAELSKVRCAETAMTSEG